MKLLVLLCFVGCQAAAAGEADSSLAIERVLSLPDNEIDIGYADLLLARDFYPDLKIEIFISMFDHLALRFNHFFGHLLDPDQRVRALNTFLYQKGPWNDSITFAYDDDDLSVAKLSNKFINGYLATRKGSCITLPMIYLVLAGRLSLPVFAVRLPHHFFVRYIPEGSPPGFQENIEATNGGGFVSDEEYKRNFQVPDNAVQNGVYLRTLDRKEYVAALLLVNADEWIARKDYERAKRYLRLSMKYDSTFSPAFLNYGLIHLEEACALEREMNAEKDAEFVFFDILSRNKRERLPTNGPPKTDLGNFVPALPGPGPSAFDAAYEDNETRVSRRRPFPCVSPPAERSSENPELQNSLYAITQRYAGPIKAKLAIYHKHSQRAEDLGIVRGYPLLFFKDRSGELKQYQQKGAE